MPIINDPSPSMIPVINQEVNINGGLFDSLTFSTEVKVVQANLRPLVSCWNSSE